MLCNSWLFEAKLNYLLTLCLAANKKDATRNLQWNKT